MPTVPSPSKSGGQGVAHLREAGAAGVAAGDGAPLGQQVIVMLTLSLPLSRRVLTSRNPLE